MATALALIEINEIGVNVYLESLFLISVLLYEMAE